MLEAQAQYRSQIIDCYFNPSGNDLFDAMTKLYYRLRQEGQDTGGLYESISQMLGDEVHAVDLDPVGVHADILVDFVALAVVHDGSLPRGHHIA